MEKDTPGKKVGGDQRQQAHHWQYKEGKGQLGEGDTHLLETRKAAENDAYPHAKGQEQVNTPFWEPNLKRRGRRTAFMKQP